MPDAAYEVARRVARELVASAGLQPPVEIEAVARTYADVVDDEIPVRCDALALHGAGPGERPRIVLQSALGHTPDRRRFAIAHELGHVLLGWHVLGSPCDITTPPRELPTSVHHLVEGEASAFARELLLPTAWLTGFISAERPAESVHRAARVAGVPVQAAARACSRLFGAGWVWAVSDPGSDVTLDAGRSPGTVARAPRVGTPLDAGGWSRSASSRHRATLPGGVLHLWRLDPAAQRRISHDPTSGELVDQVARRLDLDVAAAKALHAQVDGVAGWANEQPGTASIDAMTRVLASRVGGLPSIAPLVDDPLLARMVRARAIELVARRLSRT